MYAPQNIIFEARGDNIRFKLPIRITTDEFKGLVGLGDVWYYKDNGYFYMKPYRLESVKAYLTKLGLLQAETSDTRTEKVDDDEEGTSWSKVIASDVKVVSKISKIFNIKSYRICGFEDCKLKVYYKNGFYCPKHGLHKRGTKKVWYVTGTFDIDGDEQLLLLFGDAFTSLLHKIGMRKADLANLLKGLRGELYAQQLKEVKEKIEEKLSNLDKEYGFEGNLIEWKKNGDTVTFFKAEKMMSEQALRVYKGADKFIKGDLEKIKNLVNETMPDYRLDVKVFGDVPVVILSKKIGSDTIQVGIRAPVGEYGKAYHIWMRVNDVHMFPAIPIELSVWGHTSRLWVWRVFHTENWEARIKERLQYVKNMEGRAVSIINRLNKIKDFQASEILKQLTCIKESIKSKIIDEWDSNGTLLDLCEKVAKYDPHEGLEAFKKAIKAIYKTDYERWLVQENIVSELELNDENVRRVLASE